MTMDDIAAEARLTKRTLYHHFTSKDQLLAAVLKATGGDNARGRFELFLPSEDIKFSQSQDVTPEGRVCGTAVGAADSTVTRPTPSSSTMRHTAAQKRSHCTSGSGPDSRSREEAAACAGELTEKSEPGGRTSCL